MHKSLLVTACLAAFHPAAAAELSGVAMPDSLNTAGAHMVLNGMALRTYSFLSLHIYVAGLYLEHKSGDADAILDSPETKLVSFTFLRDVAPWAARRSWREGFSNACRAPCQLPAHSVDLFLAAMPAVHDGDNSSFLFTGKGVDVSMNGHLLGRIDDPAFARLILSTFIGAHPTAPNVKRGLLGESS